MSSEKNIYSSSPSLSFSLSSFLLFLLEDLLWEDWDADVCPALPEPPPDTEEEVEEELARTLLPHSAQERSWSRTGETPSSTRKLTWSRKYKTAGHKEKWEVQKIQREKKYLLIMALNVFYNHKSNMQLTIIFHAKLLPINCPLSGNFSTRFKMFHLQGEKCFTHHPSLQSFNLHSVKRTLTRLMRVSYCRAEPDVAVTTPARRKMPCSSRSFLMLRTWESRVCKSRNWRYFSFEPQMNSKSFLTCLLTNGVCWIIRY